MSVDVQYGPYNYALCAVLGFLYEYIEDHCIPFLRWRNITIFTAQNPSEEGGRDTVNRMESGEKWIAKCSELVGLCVLLQRFLNRLRTEVEILIAFCTAVARHWRIIWKADCVAARCWLLSLATILTCWFKLFHGINNDETLQSQLSSHRPTTDGGRDLTLVQVQANVKLPLYLIKHQAVKTYVGVEV
jgi:hypothetical protein